MPTPVAPAGILARADLRVLVCEKIAEAGVQLLTERFRVDLGLDWSPETLAERVGD